MLPTQGSRDRLRVGVRLPARARCRRPGSFGATPAGGRGDVLVGEDPWYHDSRRASSLARSLRAGRRLRSVFGSRRLLAPAEPGSPLPRHGQGTAWQIELVAGRWQLSRSSPAGDTWQRVVSTPPATRRSTPPTARRTARRLAADQPNTAAPAHAFGAGRCCCVPNRCPLAPVDDLAGACRSQKFWWRSCASTRTCLGGRRTAKSEAKRPLSHPRPPDTPTERRAYRHRRRLSDDELRCRLPYWSRIETYTHA